jgi:hypothetical protein
LKIEHPPPHFQVKFAEFEELIVIETLGEVERQDFIYLELKMIRRIWRCLYFEKLWKLDLEKIEIDDRMKEAINFSEKN